MKEDKASGKNGAGGTFDPNGDMMVGHNGAGDAMNDLVKAKIVSLVPELVKKPFEGHAIYTTRPITLVDVLRAIGSANNSSVLRVNNLGGFSWFIDQKWKDIALPRWNLTTDYDGQTQETRTFIGNLLGV